MHLPSSCVWAFTHESRPAYVAGWNVKRAYYGLSWLVPDKSRGPGVDVPSYMEVADNLADKVAVLANDFVARFEHELGLSQWRGI